MTIVPQYITVKIQENFHYGTLFWNNGEFIIYPLPHQKSGWVDVHILSRRIDYLKHVYVFLYSLYRVTLSLVGFS